MRRFLYVLTFVLIACLTQTVEARKLALLVGVDEYDNVPSLRCCVNDMKALKSALVNVGFKESDIFILTTGGAVRDMPTKEKIEQKVAEILAAAQPDDMIFFAFSGHGAREGETDYFCPPFAKTNDLEGTCVSITKVMDDLSKCPARFKWMVVDACRNDPSNTRDAKAFQVIPAPPRGVALFQSCDKGEKSYEEKREGGHGYFTKNLVAALSGEADVNHDGKLTLFEVCTWTAEQTQAEVEQAEHKTQKPFLNLSVTNFTLSEDLNVPKAKKLVEEARKAVDDENYELAVKKYDEAIALCPRFNSIKRERNLAERFRQQRAPRPGGNVPAPVVEQPPVVTPAPNTPAPASVQTSTLGTPGTRAGERRTVTVNGVEFAFRWCPAGTFMMGSPTSEDGRYDDETQHQVTLTKGFWMMETEVTVGMFKAFVSETGYVSTGNTPWGYVNGFWKQDSQFSWRNPGFSQDDNHPVTCVSWNDAIEFCKWLSKKTGQNITLPTEAQWEYACRAGSTTAYFWGNALNGDKANCNGNYPCGTTTKGKYIGKTTPVGSYQPNAWGLYDMHGNVWEWCADWYDDYPSGSVTDPTGPSNGSNRVIRGGCWRYYAQYCRSAYRSSRDPDSRRYFLGFRVVRGQ